MATTKVPIDHVVYKLYGLTEDDSQIVAGRV